MLLLENSLLDLPDTPEPLFLPLACLLWPFCWACWEPNSLQGLLFFWLIAFISFPRDSLLICPLGEKLYT